MFYLTCQRFFKKTMYAQINSFTENKLSTLFTGFRNNHNAQHCLVNVTENWKNTLDKGGYVAAIIRDLSKAFDTLNHNLLIAKLVAYGFRKDAITYMKNYLSNRLQRVRVNSSFNSWDEIFSRVTRLNSTPTLIQYIS